MIIHREIVADTVEYKGYIIGLLVSGRVDGDPADLRAAAPLLHATGGHAPHRGPGGQAMVMHAVYRLQS